MVIGICEHHCAFLLMTAFSNELADIQDELLTGAFFDVVLWSHLECWA